MSRSNAKDLTTEMLLIGFGNLGAKQVEFVIESNFTYNGM